MSQMTITPPEVDEARISIIMDNSFDMLMASTEVANNLRCSWRFSSYTRAI